MQDDNRVLTEDEWALFSTGLALLRDGVEEDIRSQTDDSSAGVPVFDRLTPEQKLALLADTARALRDPAVPMPTHTAANEGAIAAVFSMIRDALQLELDTARMEGEDEKPTEVRRMLLAVCHEPVEREEPLPDVTSDDSEEWEWLVEEFEGRIFWDTDFAMGDQFLDLPHDEARTQLRRSGIDPDFYLAVPDEPDRAGLIAARQTLARLLGLPVPDDHGSYPALADQYHDLVVGPCSPEEIAAWEDNPWVEVVSFSEPGWDCAYPTWAATFSKALPTAPFELSPAPGAADEATPDGISVERHGEGWVVRDEKGWYWCGLVENCWTSEPDEGMPALTFPTEAEARSAYAQASQMYEDREKRHEEALAKLGLSDE
jgi:hypothetical protein